MTELASGTVQFKIIQDISKKNGKPYKAIKLIFNGYELRNPTFLTDDQYELIKLKMEKR